MYTTFSEIAGKLLSGLWSLAVLFIIMFYTANLRKHLIVPIFEPEINSDDDVLKQDIKTIFTDSPHEDLPIDYYYLRESSANIFERVSPNS